jgi:hypothetical protein
LQDTEQQKDVLLHSVIHGYARGALTEPYEPRALIEALDVTDGASVVINRKKIEDDLTECLRKLNRAQLDEVRGLIGAKNDQWVDELGAVVKGDKPLRWLVEKAGSRLNP